jgi:hypothetical protein
MSGISQQGHCYLSPGQPVWTASYAYGIVRSMSFQPRCKSHQIRVGIGVLVRIEARG